MRLPSVLSSMNSMLIEGQINELLQINSETRKYGLELSHDEVLQMIEERNKYLQYIGRIELGIGVSKSIIQSFCNSQYMTPDDYAYTLHELHEIFYYMKNETEDKIGDEKLVQMMRDYFENFCGGSIELLKGKLEIFAEDFRKKNCQLNLMPKEDLE